MNWATQLQKLSRTTQEPQAPTGPAMSSVLHPPVQPSPATPVIDYTNVSIDSFDEDMKTEPKYPFLLECAEDLNSTVKMFILNNQDPALEKTGALLEDILSLLR